MVVSPTVVTFASSRSDIYMYKCICWHACTIYLCMYVCTSYTMQHRRPIVTLRAKFFQKLIPNVSFIKGNLGKRKKLFRPVIYMYLCMYVCMMYPLLNGYWWFDQCCTGWMIYEYVCMYIVKVVEICNSTWSDYSGLGPFPPQAVLLHTCNARPTFHLHCSYTLLRWTGKSSR